MTDKPITEQPRVAAALRELNAALLEAAKKNGTPLDVTAVVVVSGNVGETAIIGCKCETCLTNLGAVLEFGIGQRLSGKPSAGSIKPLTGMH